MFTNMKLGVRLGLGFAAVIMLLIACTALGLNAFKNIAANTCNKKTITGNIKMMAASTIINLSKIKLPAPQYQSP